MSKATKIIATIFGAILTLFILLFIGALLFLDPNNYRDMLAKEASKHLGHTVTLKGDLNAHYFPWLGLTAHQVQIDSSSNQDANPLANIEQLSFKVQTMPLLKNQIKLDQIIVTQAKINLVRNSKGNGNWEPKAVPATTPAQDTQGKATEEKTSTSEPSASKTFTFEIAGVQIKNSELNYVDKQNSQTFHMTDLDVKTSTIKPGEKTPIEGQFTLSATQEKRSLNNTTKFSGTLDLKNNDPIIFSINNIKLQSEVKSKELPQGPLKLDLKGQVEGNLKDASLAFKDMDLQVDESHATGQATLSWQKEKRLNFDLKVDRINADRYLVAANDSSAEQAVASDEKPAGFQLVAYSPAERFHYKGNVKVDTLVAKGLTLNQVSFTAEDTAEGLSLNPLKANLYQGRFNGQSQVNMTTKATKVKGDLNGIDVPALLTALKQEPKLTGTGNAQVNISVDKGGLNGTTKIKIDNGELRGVDLEYYIDSALSMIKKTPNTSQNRKKTPYDSITGTLLANNNVLHNNDLKLTHTNYEATGDGSIDLNKKYLEYDFVAKRIFHDGAEHPNSLPLLVRVSGPFDNIKVKPDVDAYVKAIVEREAKQAIEKQLNKQVDKLLGKDPNQEDGSSNKIQDEVEKGIKKLFKF